MFYNVGVCLILKGLYYAKNDSDRQVVWLLGFLVFYSIFHSIDSMFSQSLVDEKVKGVNLFQNEFEETKYFIIYINMITWVISFILSLYFSKNNFSIVTYYGIKYIIGILINLNLKEIINLDFTEIIKDLMENFEKKYNINIRLFSQTLTKKQTNLFFDEKAQL